MIIRIEYRLLLLVVAAQFSKILSCDQTKTCPEDLTKDEETAFHQRQKRWLTMIPNGGQVNIIATVAAPIRWAHEVRRSLAVGLNIQANYKIPAEIIWPHAESFFKERVLSEDYVDHSRRELFQILERFIQSWGGDGRECLLKTICQVAENPLKHNGFIGELLDVIFTPSYEDPLDDVYKMAKIYGRSGIENCAQLYKKCPDEHDILSSISTLTKFK